MARDNQEQTVFSIEQHLDDIILRASQHLRDAVKENLDNVATESPIEELFFAAFIATMSAVSSLQGTAPNVVADGDRPEKIYMPDDGITIIPQCRLSIDDITYRVDFLIIRKRSEYDTLDVLAVECDGFEWHDRDKDQFIAERARNRNITLAGIPVVSITGAELLSNPMRHAQSVVEGIFRQAGTGWAPHDFRESFPFAKPSST